SLLSASPERPARSCSPRKIEPEVGRSRPAAHCKNVLFPDPDGPIIAVKEPLANASETSLSAVTAPPPRPYTFDTDSGRTLSAAVGDTSVRSPKLVFPLTALPSSRLDELTDPTSQPQRRTESRETCRLRGGFLVSLTRSSRGARCKARRRFDLHAASA